MLRSRTIWREGALLEIKDREEFDAWLRKQPREVAAAFAARAALRVLPMVSKARGIGYDFDQFFNITLAVFRATAIAWVRAKYPISGREFAAAAAAASYAASLASKVASEGFSYRGRVAPRPAPAATKAAFAASLAADTSTINSALAAADHAVDTTCAEVSKFIGRYRNKSSRRHLSRRHVLPNSRLDGLLSI